MLTYLNAEGVHGQKMFDNTCSKTKHSLVAMGELSWA